MTHPGAWATPVLAVTVVVLAIAGEASVLFGFAGKSVDPVALGRVLGTLDSALMLVLAYYFGSSSSSARKDALLAAKTP